MNELIKKLKARVAGTDKEYLSELFIYLYITKGKFLKSNSPDQIRNSREKTQMLNGICDLMYSTATEILAEGAPGGTTDLDDKEMDLIAEGYVRG